MDVHRSALKHGVTASDATLAALKSLASIKLDEDSPSRQLRLGFGSAGQMLEVVVLTFDDGHELVIHAMKARQSYLEHLSGRERTE